MAFTKFWIFGPPEDGGHLLSTIDLDGRGPKGIPNVCTACHGGTFDYNTQTASPVQFDAGAWTRNGKPYGDLSAHFLPFDLANFAFARNEKKSAAEQDAARAAQEEAIYRLNQNVLNLEKPQANPPRSSAGSAGIAQLIEGWYNGATLAGTTPSFNYDFVPYEFSDTSILNYPKAYRDGYAHSCRTCHIAMDRQPFEYTAHPIPPDDQSYVCSHLMPNARVTFDRLWLSHADRSVTKQPPPSNIPGLLSLANPDQVAALGNIFPDMVNKASCAPPLP